LSILEAGAYWSSALGNQIIWIDGFCDQYSYFLIYCWWWGQNGTKREWMSKGKQLGSRKKMIQKWIAKNIVGFFNDSKWLQALMEGAALNYSKISLNE